MFDEYSLIIIIKMDFSRVLKLAFALHLLFITVPCFSAEDRTFVETANGRIYGRTIQVKPWQFPDSEGIAVEAYTKIPYAEPPVGDLRYQVTKEKDWAGELDATKPNVACPQIDLPAGFTPVDMEETEDCLYLDVFVPSPRPESAAVMVWIHGGGLYAGAGSVPEKLPIPLASYEKVIVVTFNYRLAMLGFLTTGDGEIPANLGMFDQREALTWVQENIQAFGGDSERVTIFGEEAGGASVNYQFMSPGSAGLYNRAILQSGNALISRLSDMVKQDPVEKTFKFGRQVGCDFNNSKDLVKCLREKSWEELRNGYGSVFTNILEKTIYPTVDGNFLTDTPLNLMKQGHFFVKEVLHGDLPDKAYVVTIRNEFGATADIPPPPVTLEVLKAILAGVFKSDDPMVLDTLVFMYSDSARITGQEEDYFQVLVDIFLNMMRCPVITVNEVLSSAAGKTVYLYSMTHVPSPSGATYVENFPYVFGSPLLHNKEDGPKGMSGFFDGPKEAGLSRQIMRYWANFAKTGNPNLSSLDPVVVNNPLDLEEWQPFTNDQPNYKELEYGFPSRKGVKKAKECHFWTVILPKIMANSDELSMLREMLADQVAAHSKRSCDDKSCPDQ